jgi:hypothetical protein
MKTLNAPELKLREEVRRIFSEEPPGHMTVEVDLGIRIKSNS